MQFINFRLSLLVLGLVGFTVAFLRFEDGKEYEFFFKSKFVLAPEELGGGQNVSATILVKKFGDDLIFRIKDSTFVGANVHSKSQSDIEGTFGVKRNPIDGAITHVISKSERAVEVLCKKMIVDMLSEDLSFFHTYVENYDSMKHSKRHRVKLAVGYCNADISAVTDIDNNLTEVLAQSQKRDCDVDPVIIMAGQLLMHGTTEQVGPTLEDSNFGMTVSFDTNTKEMLEVSKFSFVNLEVLGISIQARHNMVVQFIASRPISHELDFEPPFVSITHFLKFVNESNNLCFE